MNKLSSLNSPTNTKKAGKKRPRHLEALLLENQLFYTVEIFTQQGGFALGGYLVFDEVYRLWLLPRSLAESLSQLLF